MINKTSELIIIKYGLFITFLGCIWFSLIYYLPRILFFIPFVLVGVWSAIFEIPNKKVVLECVSRDKFNDATSFLNFGRDLGMLLAIIFMTTTVNSLSNYLPDISSLWESTTDIILIRVAILILFYIEFIFIKIFIKGYLYILL